MQAQRNLAHLALFGKMAALGAGEVDFVGEGCEDRVLECATNGAFAVVNVDRPEFGAVELGGWLRRGEAVARAAGAHGEGGLDQVSVLVPVVCVAAALGVAVCQEVFEKVASVLLGF